MNKRTLIAVAIIVTVIAAGMAYVLMSKEKSAPEPAPVTTMQSQPSAGPSPTKGSYVEYSAASVESAKGTKLLFFYAPWCPQCRALDASIRSSALPDNVTIFKVDYDSNQPLRSKYGVTIQTTVVKIDDAGNKVTSYTAYDEPNFDAVKQALLP